MKQSQILALILLLATGHAVNASNQQPANLHKMKLTNWYGTCSPKTCPSPFNDLMFGDDNQLQFHGGSCQEWVNHRIDEHGNTLLILDSSIKRVKKLIELGAEVDIQNEFGDTPLHRAANYDRYEVIQLLVDSGADVNQQNTNGNVPLHFANNKQIARLLLIAGTNVNQQNQFGNTPLHRAAYYDQYEVIQLLLVAGADKTIKNQYGLTAKEYATNPASFNTAAIKLTNLINSSCSIS